MKVYLVYASIDYEGIYESSMRIFKSKQKADAYKDELDKERYGDYREIAVFELDGERVKAIGETTK